MKRVAATLILLACVGCRGPLTFPAVERLTPEQQAEVDRWWDNMLTPTDRLDRGLLLDVLIFYQLHQVGVDHLHMESSKQFSGGTVYMTIDYTRTSDPSTDKLALEVKDRAGHSIRKETYSGAEVLSQVQMMQSHSATTRPDGQPTEDDAARDQMVQARLRQIMAATRPADAPATMPADEERALWLTGNLLRISR